MAIEVLALGGYIMKILTADAMSQRRILSIFIPVLIHVQARNAVSPHAARGEVPNSQATNLGAASSVGGERLRCRIAPHRMYRQPRFNPATKDGSS